jgi:hypothetical protein
MDKMQRGSRDTDDMQKDEESGRITTRLRQTFLIVFATIALLMTAYATSGGLRLFLTESYAWIGITALSVGFLAFTSLVLGDGISSNKISQIILVMPFFLVAVAICWILSFTSYHQQFLSVGKSDLANSETNLRQMGNYAYDVTKAMNDRVEDQRAALVEGETFQDYSTTIIGLADDLKDRDKKKEIAAQLETLIDAKKIELINRQASLEADQDKLKNDLERLAINIGKLEILSSEKQAALNTAQALEKNLELAMELEEGDPDVPGQQRPFIARDSLARQLVDSPACDRRRAAGKGGGTPGTCYFALTEKLAETQVLVQEIKTASQASLKELKDARQRQVNDQSNLKELMAQFEIDKQQSSEEFSSKFTLDTDGFLKSVDAFIDQPSELTFNATANYCQNVTDVLADINPASELPACAPQTLTAVFKQFNSLDEEKNAVSMACAEADRRELIIEDLRRDIKGLTGPERLVPITQSYDKMRSDVLEACLVAAEQKGLETGPIREDLASLYDQINPSQDPISKAIGKVTSLFDGTASARDYFPALLALLQELSLLLAKLFWDANVVKKSAVRRDDEDYSDIDLEAKPDDPAAVLAAKNLLLNTTFHKQRHLLPHIFDEEYSHQMQSHMRRILDNLFRKKLAKKSSRGIVILEDGMAEIARQISRHNQVVQTANIAPEPVSRATDPVELTENLKTAAPVLVNIDRQEASQDDPSDVPSSEQPDEPQDASVDDVSEENVAVVDDTNDEPVEQKQRKRRPIVVRPNFRREV